MIANIASVLSSVIGAMTDFLTPTASGGNESGVLLTTAAVASIGVLFAVPIGIKAGKKAFGLIRKI